jgi:hypothetical protein
MMVRNFMWLPVMLTIGLWGCSQRTAAPVEQPARQVQAPASEQAAQGSNSDVKIWIVNAPGDNALPGDPSVVMKLGTAAKDASVASADSSEPGNQTRDTRAGYAQAGFTINIQTGGSTTGPQSTGAVSGQTVQPNATVSQAPEQKPEAAAAIPITVALPGGAASGSASGATGQGTATLDAQQTADLRTALVKAMSGDKDALSQIAQLLGLVLSPTTQPSPADVIDGGTGN